MTRINLVEPSQLSKKHLLAEYKEITRPFNKVIRRIENGTMHQVSIPESYVLGKGHETFFFNKLKYLYDRYTSLRTELINRGVNIDTEKFVEITYDLYTKLAHTPYWKDYTPQPHEIYLNFARLAKRSNLPEVKDELYEESGGIFY